ncbi:MAG TPA: site-specific integrase [Pseudonocardiaceae bacterium]|nr:site-specific integrase [Pseudonocardiaceae bacterium]
MTAATVVGGSYRSQRLVCPSGEWTWTVLGRDHCLVEPAEEYLEYLRVQRVSPNTVKFYARALALWWQYLDAFGLRWNAVSVEDFGAFLTWLRTGDGPEVASIERRSAGGRTPRASVGGCIGHSAARRQVQSRCARSPGFPPLVGARDPATIAAVHGEAARPLGDVVGVRVVPRGVERVPPAVR